MKARMQNYLVVNYTGIYQSSRSKCKNGLHGVVSGSILLRCLLLQIGFLMSKILCFSGFAELNASCNGVINCYLNYLKPGIKGLRADADKLSHVGRESLAFFSFRIYFENNLVKCGELFLKFMHRNNE